MKVIHICQRDDPATGGAVRVAFELVKRLINHNIDARLLFLYGESGYFGKNLEPHCDYLGLKNSRDIWLYLRLNQYLAKAKPDIVHHHDDLLWPQLLTLSHPTYKKVIHAHGGGTPKPQPLKTRLLYHCQRLSADLVTCITEEAQKSQCINVGFDHHKTSIIYNGIDLRHYQPSSSDEKIKARQELNIPLNNSVIGFVGRLDNKMKGGDDFLRVITNLPNNCVGLVVGNGPDFDNLQKLARELEISERVYFTGLLPDPKLAYQAMDIFAFTSRFEPFGLTLLEALASNVPVVGFRCPGGSAEILTDDTGIVIYERDLEKMAETIRIMISNPDSIQQKLTQGRYLLETRFNWEISVEKLIDLYKTILTSN
jgi:glycosyltransferase involved in cell wall biosynthesis